MWAFHGGVTATYLGDDPRRIAAARGGSTCLDFLADVLRYLPGLAWHYLFITDAQINAVPAAWDAAHQARTSVIYIPEGGRDYHAAAARLGVRVMTAHSIDDLPHLTALAARRYFGSAARG